MRVLACLKAVGMVWVLSSSIVAAKPISSAPTPTAAPGEAQSGVEPELVVCMGKERMVIPFSGNKVYAEGATLKLHRGKVDSLAVAKKDNDNLVNLTTLYNLPEGFGLALATVISSPAPKDAYQLTVKAGGWTGTQAFTVSNAEVPPCVEEVSPEPPYIDEMRRLVKLVNAPTTQMLEEYKENAVVEVNAATGAVTPAERSKIRRGHYLIVKVTNGLIYECSVEARGEGGKVYSLPCGQPAPPVTKTEERDAKTGGVVPFASPLRQSAEVQQLPTEAARIAGIRTAMAAETKADPLVTFSQNLPVLASYRETVIELRVVPATSGNRPEGEVAAAGIRDVTLTVNAQKWGAGPGVGFVLAFPGAETFEYAATNDPTTKKVVRSSSSDANPIPFAFLNAWAWEHSQWAWSLGVGLESESQKAAFALGGTYRFSGHAQVTLGVALVPMKALPDGFENGAIVPVGDTTLQSLDYGYNARAFLGLAWRPGSQDAPTKGAESNPTGR